MQGDCISEGERLLLLLSKACCVVFQLCCKMTTVALEVCTAARQLGRGAATRAHAVDSKVVRTLLLRSRSVVVC